MRKKSYKFYFFYSSNETPNTAKEEIVSFYFGKGKFIYKILCYTNYIFFVYTILNHN